jgi:hypothetical protein
MTTTNITAELERERGKDELLGFEPLVSLAAVSDMSSDFTALC